MTNEEREKEIRKQPIPTKEECLAFYEETMKLSDVRFVPYYKMAIKSLEQQPCEDCISREDALKEACEFHEIGYNGKGIFVRLKELPSVTPSRPKGKWIMVGNLEQRNVMCNKCRNIIDSRLLKLYPQRYAYCSSCGADMRESEDEE